MHTILPVLNISVAVLGRLSLYTRPGNRLGLYSTFLKVFTMSSRLNFWSRVTDATTFTILMSWFVEFVIGSWVIVLFSTYVAKYGFFLGKVDCTRIIERSWLLIINRLNFEVNRHGLNPVY